MSQVEMLQRLVEQEELRSLRPQLSEPGALAFSSGKRTIQMARQFLQIESRNGTCCRRCVLLVPSKYRARTGVAAEHDVLRERAPIFFVFALQKNAERASELTPRIVAQRP